MDQNQISSLIESFIDQRNEIREQAESVYRSFEAQDPNLMVKMLISLVDSNLSFNCTFQSLLRLKSLLLQSIEPDSNIMAESIEFIKSKFLFYLTNMTELITENCILSAIQSYYFGIVYYNNQWNEIIPFLLDLYNTKPSLSLSMLTYIYDVTPNAELAQKLTQRMFFSNSENPSLLIESINCGLTLVNHENDLNDFVATLPNLLAQLPDSLLKSPINTLVNIFIQNHNPFLPYMGEYLEYLLNVVSNPDHSEFFRIQCLQVFSEMVNESSECRSIMLSRPQIVIDSFASALSDPNHFPDFYSDAQKKLSLVLKASLNDIDIFKQLVYQYASSSNLYISTVFMSKIDSDQVLVFVFNFISSPDTFVRQNCISILSKYVKRKADIDNQVKEEIAKVFVEFLSNVSKYVEVLNLLEIWCLKFGPDYLSFLIPPILMLMNNQCEDFRVYVIASILCKKMSEVPILRDIAPKLLHIAKLALENFENEETLEIVSNLCSMVDVQYFMQYLNLIYPIILRSPNLLLSERIHKIIEFLGNNFIPFLPITFQVLFSIANSKIDVKELHFSDINRCDDSAIFLPNNKDNTVFSFDRDQLNNISYVINLFNIIMKTLPDEIKNPEIFSSLVEIIKKYITFPYDDSIRGDALLILNDFLDVFSDNISIPNIFANSFIECAKEEMDPSNTILVEDIILKLLVICRKAEDYDTYWSLLKLAPSILKNLMEVIKSVNDADKYFDGLENEIFFQAFLNIVTFFEKCIGRNAQLGIEMFNEFIVIIPYSYLVDPNTIIPIKIFVASTWTDLITFLPKENWPNQLPDLVHDVLPLYQNQDPAVRRIVISCFGNLFKAAYKNASSNKLNSFSSIDDVGFYLTTLESIVLNDNNLSVRKDAVVHFGSILKTCNEPNVVVNNLLKFAQMAQIFEQDDNFLLGEYFVKLLRIIEKMNDELLVEVVEFASNLVKHFIEIGLLDEETVEGLLARFGYSQSKAVHHIISIGLQNIQPQC